jgi:hypothetical protein
MGCSPLLALMFQASLAIFLKRLVQSLPRRVIMLHSRDGLPAVAVELDPLYIEDHRFQVGRFDIGFAPDGGRPGRGRLPSSRRFVGLRSRAFNWTYAHSSLQNRDSSRSRENHFRLFWNALFYTALGSKGVFDVLFSVM